MAKWDILKENAEDLSEIEIKNLYLKENNPLPVEKRLR